MIFTTYILRDKSGRLYKGVTNNLVRRLREHESGHTITTSRMQNLEVIYKEYMKLLRKQGKEKNILKQRQVEDF